MLQLDPDVRELPQVFVWVKSPVIEMSVIFTVELTVTAASTVCGGLVVPTG